MQSTTLPKRLTCSPAPIAMSSSKTTCDGESSSTPALKYAWWRGASAAKPFTLSKIDETGPGRRGGSGR